MQFATILATTTTTPAPGESASIIEALPHLLGMVVVFITLAILWGLCVLSSVLVRKFAPAPAAPAPKPAPVAAAAPAGTTPEIIAAITAAVTTVVGGKARIVSIRQEGNNWGTAGRQSVLSSHRIRK